MFSEPTIQSVNHLFNTPGLGLELLGASLVGVGVLCYLGRVAWIALSNARRMELASMTSATVPSGSADNSTLTEPYCAG
jgi:hypothetical protein